MEFQKYELRAEPVDSKVCDVVNFDTTDDAYRMAKEMGMHELPEEHVMMACLTSRGDVIGWFDVAHGGIAETTLSVSNVFKRALATNAACIVLYHNHPSGVASPSVHDVELTQKVHDAGELLGIKLLDHIIVGGGEYYSFAKEGVL